MTFHNIHLPNFVAMQAKGGPHFATSHVTTMSGREVRSADRMHAIQRYSIENCRLSKEQFDQFNAFFRTCMGQQYSFLFKDYADCIVCDQIIAVGNGTATSFELHKTYATAVTSYNRKLTRLDPESVMIEINHAEINRTQFRIEGGVVILDASLPQDHILLLKHAVFYVEVRFTHDSFKYSMHNDGSVVIDNLSLVEVV